jgi:hypothetical protein
MSAPTATVSLCAIERHVVDHPHDVYIVVTELSHLVNRYDPEIQRKAKAERSLVREGFDAAAMFQTVCAEIGEPNVKIPQLRMLADEISQANHFPLPTATRNHREPLLQWFSDHWDAARAVIAARFGRTE